MYENKNKGYKNEDVFYLIRFAVTSNPVGAAVGEICDIIGHDQTVKRLKNAIDFLEN